MQVFSVGSTRIGLPSRPQLLRLNKLFGCIAIGNIEMDSPATLRMNGRGKWLDFALVNAQIGLSGTIGKATSDGWAIVSALVVLSDDKRLPSGVLIHFPMYSYEAENFAKLSETVELQQMMEVEADPEIFRIEFTKSIKTQYGSTIKPPVILTREPSLGEMDYIKAAETIKAEYPQFLPNFAELYPPEYDEDGQLTFGLVASQPTLPTLEASKSGKSEEGKAIAPGKSE